MSELSWEKPKHPEKPKRGPSLKFAGAGLVIALALFALIAAGTLRGARYFISVDELLNDPSYQGRTLRIAGAVDGESIEYDSERAIIRFEIVHIPAAYDDLAQALREALLDPLASRLQVIAEDAALPDLLRHEAQAIVTGALSGDRVFHASELLLKCPSRFEESVAPEGLSQIPEHE